jgi:hypothetical protein
MKIQKRGKVLGDAMTPQKTAGFGVGDAGDDHVGEGGGE